MLALTFILAQVSSTPDLIVTDKDRESISTKVSAIAGASDDIKAAWGRQYFNLTQAHETGLRLESWASPPGPPILSLMRLGYPEAQCVLKDVLSAYDRSLRTSAIAEVSAFFDVVGRHVPDSELDNTLTLDAHIRSTLISEGKDDYAPAGGHVDLNVELRRLASELSAIDQSVLLQPAMALIMESYSGELTSLLLARHVALSKSRCSDDNLTDEEQALARAHLLESRYSYSARIRKLNIETANLITSTISTDISTLITIHLNAALSPFAYALPYQNAINSLPNEQLDEVMLQIHADRSRLASETSDAFDKYWNPDDLYARFLEEARRDYGLNPESDDALSKHMEFRKRKDSLDALDKQITTRVPVISQPSQISNTASEPAADLFLELIIQQLPTLPSDDEIEMLVDQQVLDSGRVEILRQLRADYADKRAELIQRLRQRTDQLTKIDNDVDRIRYLRTLAHESTNTYDSCVAIIDRFFQDSNLVSDSPMLRDLIAHRVRKRSLSLVRDVMPSDLKELCYDVTLFLHPEHADNQEIVDVQGEYLSTLDAKLSQFRRERLAHVLLHRITRIRATTKVLNKMEENVAEYHRSAARELANAIVDLRFDYVPRFSAAMANDSERQRFMLAIDQHEYEWLYEESPVDLLADALHRDRVRDGDIEHQIGILESQFKANRERIRNEMITYCRQYVRENDTDRRDVLGDRIIELNSDRVMLSISTVQKIATTLEAKDLDELALDIRCLLASCISWK